MASGPKESAATATGALAAVDAALVLTASPEEPTLAEQGRVRERRGPYSHSDSSVEQMLLQIAVDQTFRRRRPGGHSPAVGEPSWADAYAGTAWSERDAAFLEYPIFDSIRSSTSGGRR